ncbi:hypothetical protein E2320_023067, partial [Naja naja]
MGLEVPHGAKGGDRHLDGSPVLLDVMKLRQRPTMEGPIRHSLSANEYFGMMPKNPHKPKGKGNYWTEH